MNKLFLIHFIGIVIIVNVQAQDSKKSFAQVLIPDSVILLDEVSVSAYRVSIRLHDVPGSLSVVFGENLIPSNGTSLASTLNSIPGVTMQSGTLATNRIVIRGMGSRTPYNTNRIKAYLNDIPLTTADGVSTPEEIDVQSLDKIEVIKGPSSALYGSGLGGSLNLFTPEKSGNELSIGTHYESFNTVKSHISGTINNGNISFYGSFGHLHSDGYRENNKYDRTSFLTTIRLKKKLWSVNSTLLLIGADGGIPSSIGKTLLENNPRAAAPNWKAIAGFKEYQKGVLGITLNNTISKDLSNHFTIFGKWNDDYEKRPFNNLDDRSLNGGFRDKFSYHDTRADLVAGFEWYTEQYKWSLDIHDSLLNENRENRKQLNVFGVIYYKPIPKLNISGAGALNYINYRLTDLYPANGDQSGKRNFPVIFSPRFGINYAPSEKLAFYGSAGHGFSLPSPEETLLPEGNVNPDIKPEQGMQYETGMRLNFFGSRLEADLTLYWIELNNLLVTKRLTEDIFTGTNAGKTRHRGFEFLLRSMLLESGTFPGRLVSNISYTWSVNRFIDFTDDGNTYNGNLLPGIPDKTFKLQLKWSILKILELSSDFQYSGYQYLNDSNSLRSPGYSIINLKAATQLPMKKSGTLNLYAGINNLTNASYVSMVIVNALAAPGSEPRYYYPGLPRHVYAGVEIHF